MKLVILKERERETGFSLRLISLRVFRTRVTGLLTLKVHIDLVLLKLT
jgi:hypothetical protein